MKRVLKEWNVSLRSDIGMKRVLKTTKSQNLNESRLVLQLSLLSGVPDYFGRNKISSGGDLSHYSSASLY